MSDPWTIENDGLGRFKAGNHGEGLLLLEKACSLDNGTDAKLHFNLALARAVTGDTFGAFAAMKRGLEIQSWDKEALRFLALLYDDWKKSNTGKQVPGDLAWIGSYIRVIESRANFIEQPTVQSIIQSIIDGALVREHVLHGSEFTVVRASLPFKPNQLDNESYNTYAQERPLFCSCYRYLLLPSLDDLFTTAHLVHLLKVYGDLPEDEKETFIAWAFNEGKRRYEEAEYLDAITIFEGLAGIEPTNIAILIYCGRALREAGAAEEIERSVPYFKAIVQLNDQNALGWYELSLSYALLGDLRKELYCLQNAYNMGHSKQDINRILYLQGIVAPEDPFA